jgi:hypothetical protein
MQLIREEELSTLQTDQYLLLEGLITIDRFYHNSNQDNYHQTILEGLQARGLLTLRCHFMEGRGPASLGSSNFSIKLPQFFNRSTVAHRSIQTQLTK